MATQEFTNAVRQRRDAPPRLLVGQDSATATSARAVLVDGDGHMQVDVVSLAGVKVEVANLEVQIEAVPDDVLEKGDSCLVGGTTDGSWDTTKAKCVKVAADGAVEVVQPTAGDLNCTEANSAAIKVATEKVATEVGVGTGLLVRQGTATNLKCEEASAATIASRLLSMIRGTAQYISAAAEACASVKATPGTINSGMVYNQGAALAYLQFHNLAAAPAGGAVPTMVLGEIGAGETVPWPCSVEGSVGLQVCLSSTRDTYTAYANMRALIWRD